MIEAMVAAGVDLMELQVPFSEPIADGPVILKANQTALKNGLTARECLDFAEKVNNTFNIPFLIMSYYNILFQYGVDRFASDMKKKGLKGAIVADLPPEEGQEYLTAMNRNDLAPILIFSPTTPFERMRYLSSFAKGFVYCIARKGVTGAETSFSKDIVTYLKRCRNATDLPLALGFGIKEKADIDFLVGKADIAVIGTQTIRIMEKNGVAAAGDFLRNLR
jgi:tryptophan synthase alpha chain